MGLVERRACFHHQRQKKATQVILVDPRQGQISCHKPFELSVGGPRKCTTQTHRSAKDFWQSAKLKVLLPSIAVEGVIC